MKGAREMPIEAIKTEIYRCKKRRRNTNCTDDKAIDEKRENT